MGDSSETLIHSLPEEDAVFKTNKKMKKSEKFMSLLDILRVRQLLVGIELNPGPTSFTFTSSTAPTDEEDEEPPHGNQTQKLIPPR